MNELEKLAAEYEELKHRKYLLGGFYSANASKDQLKHWLFDTFAVRLLKEILKFSGDYTNNKEQVEDFFIKQFKCIAEEGK